MLKIAVCDDEDIFRKDIVKYLEKYFGKLDILCQEFGDGESLIGSAKLGTVWDAIFLDIEMEKMDGMQTAAALREMGHQMPIIFLTSHTEFALEGYEVSAFRFLAKPLRIPKMEQTLSDLKELLYGSLNLLIRYEGEDILLPVDDIVYVEARNNTVRIVLVREEYIIRKKLAEMEAELAKMSDNFVRIHRGYIVNLRHVKKHHGNDVFMTGNVTLPISRSLGKDFKERLFLYVRNNTR